MNYTTVTLVLDAITSGDDPITPPVGVESLLERVVEAASRAVDVYVTNSGMNCTNYFAKETFTLQRVLGAIDYVSVLRCYPPKPNIVSVDRLQWAMRSIDTPIEVDTNNIDINGSMIVAYGISKRCVESPVVKVSYTGGIGEDNGVGSLPLNLPTDVVEATTVLAARYFKEDSSGLTDAIGVAELGVVIYTKAWPVRVKEMLKKYVRQVPL